MNQYYPKSGNIMAEPIQQMSVPGISDPPQIAVPIVNSPLERLANAGREAKAAVRQLFDEKPIPMAIVALGIGYVIGNILLQPRYRR